MKKIFIGLLTLCSISAFAAQVTPIDFVGNYHLIEMKVKSFHQPKPYCAKQLGVTYRIEGGRLGLFFNDVSHIQGYYISKSLMDAGKLEGNDYEESIIWAENSVKRSFRLKRGLESYRSFEKFELTDNGLVIRDELKGRFGLFFSKAECHYEKR
ncbi:MAG: hypothetical protein ACOYL6_15240 [Bacteriovoracaceae bacterium]